MRTQLGQLLLDLRQALRVGRAADQDGEAGDGRKKDSAIVGPRFQDSGSSWTGIRSSTGFSTENGGLESDTSGEWKRGEILMFPDAANVANLLISFNYQDGDESTPAQGGGYGVFILHYARLAERLGIEALCIGTELRQTVGARPDEWRRLIADGGVADGHR